jgi:hypothetical protein
MMRKQAHTHTQLENTSFITQFKAIDDQFLMHHPNKSMAFFNDQLKIIARIVFVNIFLTPNKPFHARR